MKIISLFCGAGGMDLGFLKAGHEIIWANDFDKDSCDSYTTYFNHKAICKPIEEVESKNIPDGDVVIGGFPCQGFSIANKYRNEKDERNKLYLELLRIINDKNPTYFIAENVAGITSLGGYDSSEDKKNNLGRVFKRILKEFSETGKGYDVNFKILNASDFGVPQNRRRTIILGTRKDVQKKLKHPTPTTIENKNTIKHAIGDLPEPNQIDRNNPLKKENNYFNHYGNKHKVKINNYMGNRKLDWNKPSPTVTGRGGGTGGPVIMVHPNLKRRMTVREYARIQEFPDDFKFLGSISSQFRQIGNAVPWRLAFHIANMLPKEKII
ncbi:DNA cytosine methyltransferase [archaeon]|jgi:DNA (cytosine-5)-methyltransferase 1|nr:DNA cytosine methyltransferase [archaeon]